MQPLTTMKVSHRYHDFQTWLTTALNQGLTLDGFGEDEIKDLRTSDNPEFSIYLCANDGENVGIWYSKYEDGQEVWAGVIFPDPYAYLNFTRTL